MTGRGGRGAALESLLQAEAARRPGEDVSIMFLHKVF